MKTTALTPLDHGFLNYERRGRHTAMDFGMLLHLPALPLNRVRELVAARLPEVPELCLALDRPRAVLRRPRWTTVEPHLDQHVRELPPMSGTGWSGAREAVENAVAQPLPRDRPLWEMLLIRDRTSDELFLLFRVHHALADGVASIQLATRLFGYSPPPQSETPPQSAEGRTALTRLIRGLPGYLRRFTPLAGRALTTAGLTGRRRLAAIHADAGKLDTAAKRHGASRNDIHLAALASALREWPHTPWRSDVRPLWTLVPCDIRTDDDRRGPGTRAVNMRIPLPCDEPDPRTRLARIAAACAAEQDGPAATMRAGLRFLPDWLVRTLFAVSFWRGHADLFASNTGWRGDPLSYGGTTVDAVEPLGLLLRNRPFGIALATYGGRVTFHVTSDAGLPHADVLCRLWLQAVDELARLPALAGPDKASRNGKTPARGKDAPQHEQPRA